MAKPQRFALAHADDVDVSGHNVANTFQQRMLALGFQTGFKLGVGIKVVFNRAFAAARHQYDIADTGGHGLFHHVLNHRTINDGDHFLGDRFRRG